jgi:hypothetical protein
MFLSRRGGHSETPECAILLPTTRTAQNKSVSRAREQKTDKTPMDQTLTGWTRRVYWNFHLVLENQKAGAQIKKHEDHSPSPAATTENKRKQKQKKKKKKNGQHN